tara:strand:+ start:40773 stop:43532 length:2760 start_codon:yes stop_codon:yes gene_type:complete
MDVFEKVDAAIESGATSLNLGGLDLTKLPVEISQLTQFEKLGLMANQLTDLPAKIGKLTQLKELDLSCNELTTLPAEIGNLRQLEVLLLDNNQLTALPAEIGKLTKLTRIYLYNNQLTDLPVEIGKLSRLRILDLRYNQLINLPDTIGNLKRLEELELRENKLSALPVNILKLNQLKALDLSDNKLTALPAEIGKLTKLTHIYLYKNQLTDLPVEIGNLKRLEELELRENKLSALPVNILKLNQLKALDLSDNKLTTLPAEIGELTQLTTLDLYRNNLTNPPIDIAEMGINAIREYFVQQSKHGAQKRYECSVMLLGAPNVGKTTLRRKVENPKFIADESEPRTVGVDILHWPYKFRMNETEETAYTHWFDFGGQEIQHMCHQFFINPNAFNVLVFPDDKCEETVSYWISLLQNMNPTNTILPICNQFNGGNYTPASLTNIEYLPQLTVNLGDCNQELFNANLALIKSHITTYIQRHAIEWITPWAQVINELNVIKNDGKPYIPIEGFRGVCAKHAIDNKEGQDLLLGYLNAIGQVLYFPKIELETVYINANWLIKAIYTLFKPENNIVHNGYFSFGELSHYWSEEDKEIGRDAYSESDQGKLKRLLSHDGFNICYDISEEDDRFFVPQYLSNARLDSSWNKADETHGKKEIFLYKVCIVPLGFMSQLIVKLSNYLALEGDFRCHWQDGMVLRFQDAWALIEKSDTQAHGQHIVVRLKGPLASIEKLRDAIFTNLREAFTSFHFYNGYRHVVPCEYCYDNEISGHSFELRDNTSTCPECGTIRVDLHRLKEGNITVNDNSKTYNISDSQAVVAGENNSVTIIMDGVEIGDTEQKRIQQESQLDELITLMKSSQSLPNKEDYIRYANNAKGELVESDGSEQGFQKWLKKTALFLDNIEQSSDLYKRGKDILIGIGLAGLA